MNKPPKQGWGLLQWGIVTTILLLMALLLRAGIVELAEWAMKRRGIASCKQVIMSLKQFSKDNSSMYPDIEHSGAVSHSANQVFRRLFKEGILDDEHIFGCPGSPYVPDGHIEGGPRFEKAVAPGECHWMLLKYQTDASPGDMPLVFENALNTSWPPKWDVVARAVNKRGRVWSSSEIIFGRNDGSVIMEKVREDGTIDWWPPRPPANPNWLDWISREDVQRLSLWDIDEK